MKKVILYEVWVILYALCAGLGHITEPTDTQAIALTLMSLIFFVPGVVLLVDALRSNDKKTLVQLRWISALSLGLTLIFMVANVLSVLSSETVGNALYEILIFVSVPMVCCQYWLLSMFLWACLLFATLPGRKKK